MACIIPAKINQGTDGQPSATVYTAVVKSSHTFLLQYSFHFRLPHFEQETPQSESEKRC